MEIKDAYKAYQNMYDCILSPSGNYNTWTSDFGGVDSDLADALRDLGTLLFGCEPRSGFLPFTSAENEI